MADRGAVDLSMVNYSRQEAFNREVEQEAWDVKGAQVIIIGCGGIGFWLGIQLGMTGLVGGITLFDKEKVEASNLNRLPVPQTWVGKPKVLCFKRIMQMLRPELAVTAVKAHITEDTTGVLKKLLDDIHRLIVFDCTDDARAQKMIYDLILSMGGRSIRYVKAGYEGHNIGAITELNAWIPADYQPGYRTTNANAITSAIAGGIAIYKMLFGSKEDLKLNLREVVNNTPVARPRGPRVQPAVAQPAVTTWTAAATDNENLDDDEEDV
jgi:hypothetical protein